jgi:hypothetical protein
MATEEQKKEFEKLVKEKQQAEYDLRQIQRQIKDVQGK